MPLALSLAVIGTLLAVEIIFRIVYRRKNGRNYHVALRFKWEDSHVVTHPFLSFAYKRHSWIRKNQPLPYPLHPNRFFSFHRPLRLNNFGHFGRDWSAAKGGDELRIACLGASTTANNIADNERDYTYPDLLGEYLRKELENRGIRKNLQVMNCGIGGWISPDILIDFELNILPLKPDYVIIYHALNDLYAFLQEERRSDYSHARTNLGQSMHAIKRAYYLPKLPFWHSYECLKDRIFGTGNIRNDVLHYVCTGQPDFEQEFQGLESEKHIFRLILILCRHFHIKCIVSTFAFYQFNDSQKLRKKKEGVDLENQHWRDLADEFSLPLVDLAASIPCNERYFVDCAHFTPLGMSLVARSFGQVVLSDIAAQSGC